MSVVHRVGVGGVKISPEEKKNVRQVLQSGRLSYGYFSKKFEHDFAAVHERRFGVWVNSGTSALRIAVAALKEMYHWRDGDEIICPASTFVASANVIIMNNLQPVFVDVRTDTYNIDPEKITAKITRRTKAIMAVHLFGQAADMTPIKKLAKKYKLRIIEDSCETMFVKYQGKTVGSFGDVSCFSTYAAHILVTGVGGLALTNNRRCAEIMRSLANHGRDPRFFQEAAMFKSSEKRWLSQVVRNRFRFERLGYSFRATEMEAALGVAQLGHWREILRARQANAAFLSKNLMPFSKWLQLPWHPKNVGHAFMMYPIVIRENSGFNKTQLVNFLEVRGIETRDLVPLINQPVYTRRWGNLEKKFPVARWMNHCGFYVAAHQFLTKAELRQMARAFKDFFVVNKKKLR